MMAVILQELLPSLNLAQFQNPEYDIYFLATNYKDYAD